MTHFRTVALLLGVVFALLGSVPAHAAQPSVILSVSPRATDIQTDGTYVIWSAPVSETFDAPRNLYVVTLAGGQPITVATNISGFPNYGSNGSNVAISNGIVIWAEGTTPMRQLRAKNLRTEQVVTVTEGDFGYPAISGNTVTWWEDYYVNSAETAQKPATLKGRNIATMTPSILLAQTPKSVYGFGPSKMSDEWVVYTKAMRASKVTGCWDLEAVRVSGDTPRAIAELGCLPPRFDIAGEQLSYINVDGLLVSMDLRYGLKRESGPHDAINLAANDRYAFWSKIRLTTPGKVTTDLWGYDILTDSAFPVLKGAIEVSSSETPKIEPAARGGLVAWLQTYPGGSGALMITRVSDVLPTARQDFARDGQLFFNEVGHTLGGSFRFFWEQNGGLAVFGFPLTEEFVEKSADTNQGYTVQYLERQRFEYHPENAGTQYAVLLGRLGAETLAQNGRNWVTEPKATAATPHYFAATGHAIAPQFWNYWRSHGLELGDPNISEREALALFGYPITEPAMEKNSSGDTVLTQWFERARFEYHPGNPDAYKVLLGRLSADKIDQRGWR